MRRGCSLSKGSQARTAGDPEDQGEGRQVPDGQGGGGGSGRRAVAEVGRGPAGAAHAHRARGPRPRRTRRAAAGGGGVDRTLLHGGSHRRGRLVPNPPSKGARCGGRRLRTRRTPVRRRLRRLCPAQGVLGRARERVRRELPRECRAAGQPERQEARAEDVPPLAIDLKTFLERPAGDLGAPEGGGPKLNP